MDELSWVEELRRTFAARLGPCTVPIGDDGAVLPLPAGEHLVLSVDAQVEGTHFQPDWLSDGQLGARAVHVAMSDLAAMGARPIGVLMAIATPVLPGRVGPEFWEGVASALDELEGALLGGDVTRSAGGLQLTVTAVGSCAPGGAWTRTGARPGDELWVTGTPGAAAAQRLELLQGNRRAGSADGAWRAPRARCREARELATSCSVHAGIDISDGLALDLRRLAEASDVGVTADITTLVDATAGRTTGCVLGGGEDYELLLAIGPDRAPDAAALHSRLGTPLTRIGRFEALSGTRFHCAGVELDDAGGWDPFRAPPARGAPGS